jgi:hypothetical protein
VPAIRGYTGAIRTFRPLIHSFARLYARARQDVPLRADLSPTQLLAMVSALPKDPGTGRTLAPCLCVVLDGVRA